MDIPKRYLLQISPLLVLGCCLAVFFSSCSKVDSELKAGFEEGRYRTIVAFGDSIVEGYRQPEGWPEILGRALSSRYGAVWVINAGMAGDTAADGLKRVGESVLEHEPDMVIISFGLNDMKNGRSVEAFYVDLSSMVDVIAGYGAKPVLLTTTRLQRGTGMVARLDPGPYNEAVRRIASEKAVPLIDVYNEFKGNNTAEYLMDVAHPNRKGYRALADIIREGLVGE